QPPNLRRDAIAVAGSSAERRADAPLAAAAPVEGRGVEVPDPRVVGGGHGANGVRLGDRREEIAEGRTPEADAIQIAGGRRGHHAPPEPLAAGGITPFRTIRLP